MAPSYLFAGVGGYYASKQSGLAGVFRCATDDTNWKHALSEIEAFTVFVHPLDPNLVFAGTADGVYRSTDRGQNFCRADFPDRGVQVWSFLHDEIDPKSMLAGGSPVSIYRSNDCGASWERMPEPHLPVHAKMPFPCRVMRFARHPRRPGEIFAVLDHRHLPSGSPPFHQQTDRAGAELFLRGRVPVFFKISRSVGGKGCDGNNRRVYTARIDRTVGLLSAHIGAPEIGSNQS